MSVFNILRSLRRRILKMVWPELYSHLVTLETAVIDAGVALEMSLQNNILMLEGSDWLAETDVEFSYN